MITYCAWCEAEGTATVISDDGRRDDGPDGDTLVSHGCCARHSDELLGITPDDPMEDMP